MQQRVSIARALLLEAEVMCMDEPFAALDEFTREQMHVELLSIWERQGFTGIFVTHNIFESAFLSDRVLVMTPRPGRVVAEVAIDLPRPRHKDMIGTLGFTENVRRIRDAMSEHWTG
jgi:NitT/TauT family transport system ATP-binding protein